MEDKCLCCGADVSDLGDCVCNSCYGKTKVKSLSDRLKRYRIKLDRAQKYVGFYLRRLNELQWYQIIQRNYVEIILDVYGELIVEYEEIIDLLETELKHLSYTTMGGNAEVEDKIEQLTFNFDEN